MFSQTSIRGRHANFDQSSQCVCACVCPYLLLRLSDARPWPKKGEEVIKDFNGNVNRGGLRGWGGLLAGVSLQLFLTQAGNSATCGCFSEREEKLREKDARASILRMFLHGRTSCIFFFNDNSKLHLILYTDTHTYTQMKRAFAQL